MVQKELELLCIGNALVDIFAFADEEIVIRNGITQSVQHVEFEKIRDILSELKDHDTVMSSGGGAANVAKIAGFLGAEVCFTGTIGGIDGTDNPGQLFTRDLNAAGVKLRLSLKSSPTGVCLYLRTGGKIRIAASPSAALELSESDISEKDLQKAAVVVIDGFILNRSALVYRILSLADRYGTVAALDLSSVSIAAEYAKEIAEYTSQHSLILFMNEAEAKAFYGRNRNKESETGNEALFFQEACEFLKSLTAGKSFPIIVVKLGERGAVCFAGGTVYRAETPAIFPLESTGAGDAFCAAFLTAWVRKKTPAECAALGNKAARIVLEVAGTGVEREQFKSIVRQLNFLV